MNAAFQWPSSILAAVSLTYDDGLPIHTTLVAPTLERYGLRGTFYPPILSDLRQQPDRWRELAAAGHELGNHTIFHPCRRIPADQYAWLDPSYDLSAYSPDRLRAELVVANFVLTLLDGKTKRTFGNTCCHTTIGQGLHEQPVASIVSDVFVAARGALTQQPAVPSDVLDLLDVGCISADGRSLQELQAIVQAAQAQGGWAVLMLHGVGPDSHDLHLERDVHQQFIAWLAQQSALWVAPFIEIATYVEENRRASASLDIHGGGSLDRTTEIIERTARVAASQSIEPTHQTGREEEDKRDVNQAEQ